MKKRLFLISILCLLSARPIAASPERVQFLYNNLTQAADFKARVAAAFELGKISDQSIVPHFEQALTDEKHPAVRLATINAMAQIPGPESVKSLLYLALHHVLSAKEQAAIQTVIWTHKDAFPLQQWSLQALSSPYDQQRAMSFWILGLIGTPSVTPILLKGLEDPSPHVLKRIIASLQLFTCKSTLDAFKRLTQSTLFSIQSMAKFCHRSISHNLYKEYLPAFKEKRLELVPLKHKITPAAVMDYVQNKQADMALDQYYAPIQPYKAKAKNLTFQTTDSIASTSIQTSVTSKSNFHKLDIEVIQTFIKQKFALIQGCYENRLQDNPTLKMDMSVSFIITPASTPKQPKVTQQSQPDPALAACVLARLKELRFPSIKDAKINAQYTFSFRPPEKKMYLFEVR